jgi:antitoxin (DNA-binding transcriptional repressor) of toxin-antitoxin stability system
MRTMSVAELKSQFSSVINDLKQGKEIAITYGRGKQPLGKIVPQSKLSMPDYSIRPGDLQEQGWSYKMQNFDLTDEDLIGS